MKWFIYLFALGITSKSFQMTLSERGTRLLNFIVQTCLFYSCAVFSRSKRANSSAIRVLLRYLADVGET